MRKNIHIFLLTVFISFMAANYVQADALPDEPIKKVTKTDSSDTKKATPKKVKKKKKKQQPKKIIEDDNIDTGVKEGTAGAASSTNENTEEDQLACITTPVIEPEYPNLKPLKKGNNLMRKPGSSARAGGEYIQISGMVVDQNCLPIQGAVIEIWQADSIGNYEWEYDKESYWKLPLAGKDNNFLFSGSSQTDNLGEFDFMTILPAPKGDSAPYINVIVKREGYKELHTRIYFAGHPANKTDITLQSLTDLGRNHVTATGQEMDPKGMYEGKIYYFPITMSGISPYKRF